MKTIVITKVYEIRESAKGYSQAIYFYFNKDRAESAAKALNEQAKENNYRQKYRVVTRDCMDCIVYTED